MPPTARPAAGDTRGDRERLREAVARWLFENTAWTPYVWDEGPGGISEQHRDEWREDADRLLALPELAALLDAAEILTAVRELHHRDDTEPYACDYCGQAWPCDVIHALDTALADQP